MDCISIYDIAFLYINKNYKEISKEEKLNVINAVHKSLKNGAVTNDLISKINKNTDIKKLPYNFFNISSSGNLLDPDVFYYHNFLRCIQKAPIRYWDINIGDIKIKEQEYFLEIKASCTINDILEYIKKKEFLCKTLIDKSRALGSISFLLKKYDIDFLLFLFDTVNDIYNSRQKYARSLIEVSEFELEAKLNYEQKITESKISGQDKVVHKKRELFKCAK